jgi:hypothetical protein
MKQTSKLMKKIILSVEVRPQPIFYDIIKEHEEKQ